MNRLSKFEKWCWGLVASVVAILILSFSYAVVVLATAEYRQNESDIRVQQGEYDSDYSDYSSYAPKRYSTTYDHRIAGYNALETLCQRDWEPGDLILWEEEIAEPNSQYATLRFKEVCPEKFDQGKPKQP